jgi:hypothetical protein
LYRNASRTRYDSGDVIRRDAFAKHSALAITLSGDLALKLRNRGVTQTRRSFKIALALCDLQLVLGLFKTELTFLISVQPLALCPVYH